MIEKNFGIRLLSSVVLLPLVSFIIFYGSYIFNFLLIFSFLISLSEWNKFKINYIIKFLGIIFLLFSFYFTYLFRSNNSSITDMYFFLVTIICISSDLGGYIFGNIFKGPKLTKISPNKTISGVIGAYLLSLCFSYLFLILQKNLLISFIDLIILIIFASSISQIGDLIISYLKRLSNLKDTGKIIPGHGGILDRIDGMIFAFPIVYLMIVR